MERIIALFLVCISIPAHACNIIVTYKHGVCSAKVLGESYKCSIGRNGITADKQEGDGKTPIGTFHLREVFYRADRIPATDLANLKLPVQVITKTDGWCDDSKNKRYNTLIDLNRFGKHISHENLYREDDVYNLIVVVGYNDAPVVPYKGSAIFIHVAKPHYAPTAGCVGFAQEDLLKILAKLVPSSQLIVQG